MKVEVFILSVLVVAMSGIASADEGKECEFRRDDVKCKVRLIEDGHKPHDVCEKVKVIVDCNCDFQLRDDDATRFEKKDDQINVATERDKLAVVVVRDEYRDHDGGDQDAVLTISAKGRDGKDGRDEGFARRLTGECRKAEW